MTNVLPVSKLISVAVTITPTAAQGLNLNSAMIIGDTEGVIDTTSRYRTYLTLAQVAGDFGSTSSEYLAATVFFGQNPQPSLLYIGRWAKTATHGRFYCGPLLTANQAVSAWTAITNGAFLVYEDGVPLNVTGLNFATATTLNGVASTIQTAMVALEANTTVVYNLNFTRFEFGSGTSGTASSLSFFQTSAAVGNAVFNANPVAADTLTINGSTITFVAANPVGNQVLIGNTQAVTLANLISFLNSTTDVNIRAANYNLTGSTVYGVAVATGTGGNGMLISKNSTAITSVANFAGGVVGTDISVKLVGTNAAANGAYAAPGVAAETALASVQAIEQVFANFYAMTFAAGFVGGNNADILDADHLAIAAYVEGDSNRHIYGLTTAEGAALLPNDVTSIGAQLKALSYNRTFFQWSSHNSFAVCSLIGLGATVNFSASNSTITFAWKQEPGIVAENFTASQSAALDANNYNYFAAFNNNTSITLNGTVASGHYIDEIWNADWFASSLQTSVYNLFYTSPTKIPQTDAGSHTIAATMKGTCVQAANNGFVGPGTWNSSGFGQLQQGQFMPTGYYIYTPPIVSQNQSDRGARKSVTFQIALKEAGAVHDVLISATVNQ